MVFAALRRCLRSVNVLGLVALAAGHACTASVGHTHEPPPIPPDAAPPVRVAIPITGWQLQSSALATEAAEVIGSTDYVPHGWHPAVVPGTVVGALVADATYPDPFVGMNLRGLPGGHDYDIGTEFYRLPMSAANPHAVPWWYRGELQAPPPSPGRRTWLRIDGVNYRAAVWLGGHRVADEHQVVGAFRSFLFDVTELTAAGRNAVALEVTAPTPDDLAINWVDWAPFPPDKNQGVWRPVEAFTTGPIELESPNVTTDLDLPSLAHARLTVTAIARNGLDHPVHARVEARIEVAPASGGESGAPPAPIVVATDVDLAAGEVRELRFDPAGEPALTIAQPRLWWPFELGPQNLYALTVRASVDGVASDEVATRFGVREVGSELTSTGARLFSINGRRILVRGGGWAPDLLLRSEPGRVDDQLAYVRDMRLNTIRLEGKLGDPHLLDRADELGILVIAGWCCCDHWEAPDDWDDEDHVVAVGSLEDQIRLLRSHPSVLAWLNGSDHPPIAATEQAYVDALTRLDWRAPVIAAAGKFTSSVTGPTGVKMTGPYGWVPPNYWSLDQDRGGAFGFNTETSPGAAIPPAASLRRFLPADHLWPVDDVWRFHAGGSNVTEDLGPYLAGLDGRYGSSANVDELAGKSQLAAYEGIRAMYEAYGRSKYRATGVIQWMLNDPWPGLIWHLYDWYLTPGGGYFGAKKACEPVHVQYGYDDRAVVVVNSTPTAIAGLAVHAQVLDLGGKERWRGDATLDVADDGVATAMTVPDPGTIAGLGDTYLVRLQTTGPAVTDNVYWLSRKPDVLDWAHANWFATPTTAYADLTGLAHLAPATVKVTATRRHDGNDDEVRVVLEAQTGPLAFFVRAEVVRSDDAEVAPIRWTDNYVTLLPGEHRELVARYRAADAGAGATVVRVSGGNVAAMTAAITAAP